MPLLAEPLLDWYATHARELPWRRPGTSPWAVLVSEVMLQQTPVARVLEPWAAWLARWPTPAALAAAAPGDAVRMWGRLGYPRRALRLHEAARAMVTRHGGAVPADLDALLALPGVGAYTSRAVAAFAFGQRHAVVDTNVRRVLARVADGVGAAGLPSVARDLAAASAVLPDDAHAARFSVALMELGAVVCTARSPRCDECPLAGQCAWLASGRPAFDGPVRRQAYAGTDRQARGALLGVLRDSVGPVAPGALDLAWAPAAQRSRAIAGLLADGLVEQTEDGAFQLPA